MEAISIEDANYKNPRTGNAVMIGDDPQNLIVKNTCPPQVASPKPFEGRYPCGSLVYNGVWYYGTYCLGPTPTRCMTRCRYNWPIMGPMPGFRISTDYGKTWTPSPLSPEQPLFPEPAKRWGPVKMGSPHFVDFGKNMEYSPDGKAYLVGMGAEENDPKPRYANLSWISADQVYLARVTPSIENINDIKKYEFFAGHDAAGKPIWTGDFAKIKPLLDWNNKMGVRHGHLRRPLEKVPDVRDRLLADLCENAHLHPRSRCDHRTVAAGDLYEGFRRAGLFREYPLEVHQLPTAEPFGSVIRRIFATGWNGRTPLKVNPPGSGYGLSLHEVRLLAPGEPPPKNNRIRSWRRRTSPEKRKSKSPRAFPATAAKERRTASWADIPNDISKEWASQRRKGRRVDQAQLEEAAEDRSRLALRPADHARTNHRPARWNSATAARSSSKSRCPTRPPRAWKSPSRPKPSLGSSSRSPAVKEGSSNIGLAEFGVFQSDHSRHLSLTRDLSCLLDEPSSLAAIGPAFALPPRRGGRVHRPRQPRQPRSLHDPESLPGAIGTRTLPWRGLGRMSPGLQCLVSIVGWGGPQITERLLGWNLAEDGKPQRCG